MEHKLVMKDATKRSILREPLPAWPFLAQVSAPGWSQCFFHRHRPNKSFKPTR
jgi:hypothetical protein